MEVLEPHSYRVATNCVGWDFAGRTDALSEYLRDLIIQGSEKKSPVNLAIVNDPVSRLRHLIRLEMSR